MSLTGRSGRQVAKPAVMSGCAIVRIGSGGRQDVSRDMLRRPRLSTCRPFLIPASIFYRIVSWALAWGAGASLRKRKAGPACFLLGESRHVRQLMQIRVCAPVP